MIGNLTDDAKALLLLTAPLIVGRSSGARELLTLSEYNDLARVLRSSGRQPADLLASDRSGLTEKLNGVIARARLERLLGRGFLLSQAIEQWQARAIWIVSRADAGYPQVLKRRLRERAPPILYGCGDARLLDTGGLAVVGSRDASSRLIEETEAIGRAAAAAGRTLVSGGARGIDQAAMRGALDENGKVVGVLCDNLARAAVAREHRESLMDGRLVLVSPCDPSVGFQVGNAMQRNKLIYAFADAALVMAAEKPGGTWSGAEEQLSRFRFVPVFTRSTGDVGPVLRELQTLGAQPWSNPKSPAQWNDLFTSLIERRHSPEQVHEPSLFAETLDASAETTAAANDSNRVSADALFARFRELVVRRNDPRSASDIAREFDLALVQTNAWLKRLVDEGAMEKLKKPVRYRTSARIGLFAATRSSS